MQARTRKVHKGHKVLLGIDIGTSELKAALFDEDGVEVATVAAEYHCDQPEPGFAELDPEVLWRNVCDAVRRLTTGPLRSEVCAAALSVHGESFVAVDRNGSAITPVILNVDSRGAVEMEELVATFGRAELYQKTGLPPHPMYTLPKIKWLRKHRGADCERVAQFLCLHEYLLSRITQSVFIDESLASRTLGFDVISGVWDDRLLAAAGVSASQMARASAGGVPAGHATRGAAREMGLPESVLWVTGGHDQACCSVGAGGLAAATAVDGTGTFECISVATEHPLISEATARTNIPCERHTVPSRFLSLTYTPGGLVLKWCRQQLPRDTAAPAGAPGRSVYDVMLADVPKEPTGLYFFPYLFGTGTPWLDSSARAAVCGMDFATSRESLVKAALEGVTYEMRQNLEILEQLGVPIKQITAVGGGAKSPVWLQLKADIFGREILALSGEAACRGAAICAGVGSGVFSNFEEGITSALRHSNCYQPQEPARQRYDELFERYKEISRRLYGFSLPECGSAVHT